MSTPGDIKAGVTIALADAGNGFQGDVVVSGYLTTQQIPNLLRALADTIEAQEATK